MKEICLKNTYFRYVMLLDEDDRLFHGYFVPVDASHLPDPEALAGRAPLSPEVIVNTDFEPLQVSHGVRYFYPPSTARVQFQNMTEQPLEDGGTLTVITLLDPAKSLLIHLHYEVYPDSPALRRYTVLENAGERSVEVVHVSSFVLPNLPYGEDDCTSTYLHAFASGWSYEAQPWVRSFGELGIFDQGCRSGFTVESSSTWVCREYFPYFVVEQRQAGLFTAVQIEYSSSWRFEAGAFEVGVPRWYYLQGGMGNHPGAHWSKKLVPGERFTTPPAALTVAQGSKEDVFDRMRTYQQNRLIRHCEADRDMPIIYNDWPFMQADVNEQKILEQLDTLRECGVDYYVTDAGWFTTPAGTGATSSWWERAGHWEPDPIRFPHGLTYIVDRIKEKGMRAGIWCEIEAIGTACENYDRLSMLLTRDGVPVEDTNRRFLNFTSPEGRAFADMVIDRIAEWGFEYIKIDYNADSAPGCSTEPGESLGQGLHANRMAYYAWLDDVRRRHPRLIIENCSSGGMRLEYGMLSRTDMASVTDQGDYRLIGAILCNVVNLISPDQCGTWSWLEDSFDADTFAFALTNSMAGRMHISGNLLHCGDEKRQILQQAIALYKQYRHIFPHAKVFHHTGDVCYYKNDQLRVWEVAARDGTESVIVIQRPNASEDTVTVHPAGILPSKEYHVTVFPDGRQYTLSGEELLQNGLHAALPHPFTAKTVYLKEL